jgi:hypothetical protein
VKAGRSSRNISIEIDVEPTIALEAVAADIEDMNFVVAFRVDDSARG